MDWDRRLYRRLGGPVGHDHSGERGHECMRFLNKLGGWHCAPMLEAGSTMKAAGSTAG